MRGGWSLLSVAAIFGEDWLCQSGVGSEGVIESVFWFCERIMWFSKEGCSLERASGFELIFGDGRSLCKGSGSVWLVELILLTLEDTALSRSSNLFSFGAWLTAVWNSF